MRVLIFDLKQSLVALFRQPGYSIVATLVLALGIGIGCAVVSVVTAILAGPTAVLYPSQLVYVYASSGGNILTGMSAEDFSDLSTSTVGNVFGDLAGHNRDKASLAIDDEPLSLLGEMVTSNFFDVLGVGAGVGRVFQAGDSQSTGSPVVVISDGLWRREFNADPAIIGRTLRLDPRAGGATSAVGLDYTIIGVADPKFDGMLNPWERVQYWTLFDQRIRDYLCDQPDGLTKWPLVGIGRVANGSSADPAKEAVRSISERLRRDRHPDQTSWALLARTSARNRLPFDSKGKIVPESMAVALGVVAAVVLLISVVNLVGLALARAASRHAETALRLALGISRPRLFLQVLIESWLIALAGLVVGLLFAMLVLRFLAAQMPNDVAESFFAGAAAGSFASWPMLISGGVIAGVAGALVGVAPALKVIRRQIQPALAGTSGGGSKPLSARVQRSILLPQLVGSVVLLVIAASLSRGVLSTTSIPLGFDPHDVTFAEFAIPRPPLCAQTPGLGQQFGARRLEMITRLEDRSGRGFALATRLPMDSSVSWVVTDGGDEQHLRVTSNSISSSYFDVLGVALRAGRFFDPRDEQNNERTAIISASLAGRIAPAGAAMGRRIGFHEPGSRLAPVWMTVVGIVGDVHSALDRSVPAFTLYTPIKQRSIATVIIAKGAGMTVAKELRSLIVQADAGAEIVRTSTIQVELNQLLYPREAAAAVFAVTGLLGLLLSAVGLYGLVSYTTGQRIREMAIRSALGASRVRLAAAVLFETVRTVVVGTLVGVLVAITASTLVSHAVLSIPQVKPADVAIVLLILGLTVAVACVAPLRRVLRLHPSVVLRSQ